MAASNGPPEVDPLVAVDVDAVAGGSLDDVEVEADGTLDVVELPSFEENAVEDCPEKDEKFSMRPNSSGSACMASMSSGFSSSCMSM